MLNLMKNLFQEEGELTVHWTTMENGDGLGFNLQWKIIKLNSQDQY